MGGGSIATRGLLVQTLVALLDVVQAEPPFTDITLEPAIGDEQFDFVWRNSTGSYAVQVKSTTNLFMKSDVVEWARKLEAAHTNEHCQLMLVGHIHPSLVQLARIGKVEIRTKPLDLAGLFDQAAHRVAKFIHSVKLNPGNPDEHEMIARALVTEFELYATDSKNLKRDALVNLLRHWVAVAPRIEPRFDISRILKYTPAELVGREEEKKLLSEMWGKVVRGEPDRPSILTLVALGGEGKTALVAKWMVDELRAKGWPGCDAAFAWSFYSQGTREQQAASSDLFLKAALTFFGDEKTANSAEHASEKGKKLASLVGQRRCLLILDGLEPLQYPTEAKAFKPGALKDDGIAKLLKGLATASQGLCIVTTRIGLPDLDAFKGSAVIEQPLKCLSREAGVDLLKRLGVKGSDRRTIPLEDGDEKSEKVSEFEKLVEDVKGHALTLTLLGGFLKRAFHGDIRQRDRVKFEKADERMDGGHAFRTMAAYEQWLLRDGGDEGRREVAVLRLMGLFDRPADAGCLHALLQPPAIPGLTEPLVGLAEDDWEYCLSGLETAKLLTVNRDASGALVSLDAHPHIREYFAKQLREGRAGSPLPAAGTDDERRARSGAPYQEAWRAAHRRLYEHLCASTPDKPQPALEDLQPLYQAVAHGCQAGLQQEACEKLYIRRILRGMGNDGFYTMRKLGLFASDLGAVACFFEQPWNRISPSLIEPAQAWLLSEAAVTLRALGRLAESLEPMRTCVNMCVTQEDWKQAAANASNLSELELTLGEVAGAVGDAEQSVTYADRSGDAFMREVTRTVHADALHQAGRRPDAETRFREAEQMQMEMQPDYPLLYSLRGFKHCDLLLAAPERAAWQVVLGSAGGPRPQHVAGTQSADESNRPFAIWAAATGDRSRSELSESCRAVSQRAAQTLKWEEGMRGAPLLDIALDHLTLGRAALYAFMLGGRGSTRAQDKEVRADVEVGPPDDVFETARRELDAAVDGLRRAASQDHIPRGLLTRAWLRFLSGARTGPESTQADLDEAWEIAERGPMKLFMADILLTRCRLFGRQKLEARSQELGEREYPWESPAADLKAAEELINKCGYHRRAEELADAKMSLGL